MQAAQHAPVAWLDGPCSVASSALAAVCAVGPGPSGRAGPDEPAGGAEGGRTAMRATFRGERAGSKMGRR